MGKVIVVTLLLATAALANPQDTPTLSHRLFSAWAPALHVIVAPASKADMENNRFSGTHDYFAEASTFLKSNPDAPYLCAVLNLSLEHPATAKIQAADEIRNREVTLCKSYRATKEQIATVQRLFYPPPPSRREEISNRTPDVVLNERRGPDVYLPPPANAVDWLLGTVTRDYRSDVQQAFDAEPLLAAHVCYSLQPAPSTAQERVRTMNATLIEICKAFPDSKIETAYRAYQGEHGRAWLNGLLNSMLDASAKLSVEDRNRQASDVVEALPRSPASGTTRFQNALRAITLEPDDFRGPAAVVKYLPESSWATPGAQTDDAKSWLGELYAKQTTSGPEATRWKRGARTYYALTGEIDKALALARELEATNDRDQHSLDRIYLASLQRAAGDAAPYEKLMADCPAPDLRYLALNGTPARPVKYCEDIVADFSKAMREQLHGTPQGMEFAKMAVETNRVAPNTSLPVFAPAITYKAPVDDTDDWFSSVVHTQEARVEQMTTVQREETGYQLQDGADGCHCDFEKAMYLLMLRPWHEGGTSNLLRMSGNTLGRKQSDIKRLLAGLFEKKAASSGTEGIEWKRGLRNFLLFSGDFVRAREVSRDLMKFPDPHHRDAVMLGIAERILGDRKPLDHAIEGCAGPSQQDAEYIDHAADEKPSDSCRMLVVWHVDRDRLMGNKPPAAEVEMMAELALDPNAEWLARLFAADNLTYLDPSMADRTWRALINDPKLPEEKRAKGYRQLARIASLTKNWVEGLQWIDQYDASLFLDDRPFGPASWRDFIDVPEHSRSRDEFTDTIDLRLDLAIGAKNFASARRAIEDLVAWSVNGCRCAGARFDLLRLAEAEIDAGQRQEPIRILGYLARQPLDAYMTAQLDGIRKKLGTPELKREDSPWDTPARPGRPRKQPPQPPLKTSVST